jgi:four helix bundle protein
MTEITNKIYDLEKRTLEFSKIIIRLCNKLNKTVVNIELIKQIIRSGSSVGANYREANEALGRKDFAHRMRIVRKEAKETSYWLDLIVEANPDFEPDINLLKQECQELRNIFSSIINKAQ